jgi:nitroreductase
MNPTLETLQALHSTHGDFDARDISASDLNRILDTCVLAANASNKQSYAVVVVRDKERMQELTPYVGSAALVFCVDSNRLQATAARLGLGYRASRIMTFLTAYTDTCLAAQTAAIAAQSLGIDSLFTNGIHRGDVNRVYKTLELPATGCFPVIELVLGYAQTPASSKRGRLSGAAIVHEETYSQLSDRAADDIIAQFDNPDLNLSVGTQWRETHEHFLGWFFDVWMNRMPPQEGPSTLFNRLVESGFLADEC